MDDGSGVLAGIALVCLVIITIVLLSGGCGEDKFRREAISHGAAYYHPETGKFTWKEKETSK